MSTTTTATATVSEEDRNEAPAVKISRRPKGSLWRQQEIPAFRPLLTRERVSWTFCVVGLVAMAVGWGLKAVQSDDVYQRKVQYDGSGADLSDCKIARANEGKECTVTIKITHKMPKPVYVYYEIENFYQNHERYLSSLDSDQLLGSNLKKSDLSDCSPLKKNGTKVLNPCGLQANSLFNDVITLQEPDLTMRESKIAWRSDRKEKFSQPNHFHWSKVYSKTYNVSDCLLTTCPPSLCDEAGVHHGCRGYKCRGGDFDQQKCEAGDYAVFYYRGFDYYQFLYETFPDIISPLVGVENEHFIVWMRLAGLSTFQKLYGRVTDTLEAGTDLKFTIKNNFDVDSFNGKKSIVISTTSTLGANLSVLWVIYVSYGAVTFFFAAVLFLKGYIAPRQLGDTSFLANER